MDFFTKPPKNFSLSCWEHWLFFSLPQVPAFKMTDSTRTMTMQANEISKSLFSQSPLIRVHLVSAPKSNSQMITRSLRGWQANGNRVKELL